MDYDKILSEVLLMNDDDRARLFRELDAYLTIREKTAAFKDVRWNDDNYWDKLI